MKQMVNKLPRYELGLTLWKVLEHAFLPDMYPPLLIINLLCYFEFIK